MSLPVRLKKSAILNGFMITLLGSGTSKVILVLSTFMCSNLLGKEEFGELSFVRNTLNMILCVCALNFTALCTKFTTEAKNSVVSYHRLFLVFLSALCICVILGLFVIIAPEFILLKLFGTLLIVKFFKIAGFLLPLFMLQPLIEGVLRGLMKFKLIGILQTLSSIIYLFAIYLGIEICGLKGALYGVVFYYSLYAILCIVSLGRLCSIKYLFQKTKGFHRQGAVIPSMILPVFFMSFIEAPALWIAQVILSKAQNMEAIGSMTAILQIRNLAMLIPGYFTNTYLSFAGELNAKKYYQDYYRQFSKIEKSYWIIGILLFLFFSITSKPILLLYGRSFVCDWPVMVISNFAIPVVMLASLYRIDLLLKDHQSHLLLISIVWNTIWLFALYALVNLNISPLYSFFISQNIAAVVFVVSLYLVFLKDKKTLLR